MDSLTPETVAAFLAQICGQTIDPATVQSIGHGAWSRAFYFRSSDGGFVVRFSVLDEDFQKDQRALRFASAGLPIPRLVEIGQAFDGYYAISERSYGQFIEDRDQQSMQRLLPSLFDVLDACRAADVSTASGFGLWRADGNASHATWRQALLSVADDVPTNRTYGWRARLRQSEVGQRAFDAGYQQLEHLVDACPNERHLLHSDLLNFNILVQDNRINAVLDWGSSMYGDFLWDLAWLTFWQPWYQSWSAVDLRSAARERYASIGLPVPDFVERMRCYELAIGLDGLAYQSFAGHWENLAWTSRRVLSLL
jgi:hygromycin-B 4-O-kinase